MLGTYGSGAAVNFKNCHTISSAGRLRSPPRTSGKMVPSVPLPSFPQDPRRIRNVRFLLVPSGTPTDSPEEWNSPSARVKRPVI